MRYPCSRTHFPVVGWSLSAIRFSSVDLPAPLGPTMPMRSPAAKQGHLMLLADTSVSNPVACLGLVHARPCNNCCWTDAAGRHKRFKPSCLPYSCACKALNQSGHDIPGLAHTGTRYPVHAQSRPTINQDNSGLACTRSRLSGLKLTCLPGLRMAHAVGDQSGKQNLCHFLQLSGLNFQAPTGTRRPVKPTRNALSELSEQVSSTCRRRQEQVFLVSVSLMIFPPAKSDTRLPAIFNHTQWTSVGYNANSVAHDHVDSMHCHQQEQGY
eukprot:scaffold93735_cov17-Tisochrysis_lutea.AAC.1